MAVRRASTAKTRLQRQLAESQALAQIGSWEWNVRNNRLTWTDEHYHIWGFPPRTPIDMNTFTNGIHPADRDRVQHVIDKSLRDGKPYRVEFRVCRADGTERIVEARAKLELDALGRPLRSYGTAQDITERTRLAASLKRFEERYREAVENAVEGVFRTTPDGRFVMANRALARMLRYETPQQLLAELTDIARQHYVDPEERARFMQVMDTQGIVQGFEYEAYRRDGSRIWLRDHSRVVRDSVGNLYYEGTVQDVTFERLARTLLDQQARQQGAVARFGQHAMAERNLETLFDCATTLLTETLSVEFSSILELRSDGDFLLRTGVGWSPDLVGKVLPGGARSQAGLTLSAGHPIIMADWGPALRDQLSTHFRDHNINSGMTVIIGTASRPWGVLGAHAVARRSFTVEDVNFLQGIASMLAAAIARRQGEETREHLLARALSAQEEERARIARELHDETGQALSAVLIGLRSIHDAPALEQVRTLTLRLRELAFTAARDVGRIARGLRPSTLDDLGLLPALRRYADDLSATRGTEITMGSEGVDRLPREMETTLYRIVQEALTNATRHASAHHVRVDIARANGTVRTTIRDDGRGFDVAAALTPTREPRTLGLVGMRERASLLGGTLVIESQAGAGARIVVDLPIENAP